MDLEPRRLADTVVLTLPPRIDQSNVDAFGPALAPHLERCAADEDRVVLDLSRLEYVSTAALRVFMLAAKQVKPRGGTIVLSGLTPLIQEVFEIVRFTNLFPIVPTLREAVARVSTAALAELDRV
jgi:stage II sporulation protein AA (anti-sigma F factor antagonist)